MGDTETQAARLLVTLETKVGPALVKVQTYRNPDLTQANPRLTPGPATLPLGGSQACGLRDYLFYARGG